MRFSAATLSAAAFVDLPYSPELLLDSGFNAAITSSSEFESACQWGYDTYFDDRYEWDDEGTGMVFVAESYPFAEVIGFVFRNIFPEKYPHETAPLACRAGVILGWLSAHALVDRPVSLLALEVLRVLLVSRPL